MIAPPLLWFFVLTYKCNLNCKYCFLGDKSRFSKDIMSFDTFKACIDDIKKQWDIAIIKNYDLVNSSQRSFTFIGGEPLLYPLEDFKKLIGYMKETLPVSIYKYTSSIITNGTLLTDDWINYLNDTNKDFPISLGISYDGPSNDRMRNDKSLSFEDSLKDIVKKIKFKWSLISTFSSTNCKNFNNVIFNNPIAKGSQTDKNRPFYMDEKDELDPYIIMEYYYKPGFDSFLKDGPIYLKGEIENILFRSVLGKISNLYSHRVTSCRGSSFCGACGSYQSFLPDGTFTFCNVNLGDTPDLSTGINIKDFDFLKLTGIKKWVHNSVNIHKVVIDTKCDICPHKYYCPAPCVVSQYKENNMSYISDRYCNLSRLISDYIDTYFYEILQKIYGNKKSLLILNKLDKIDSLKMTSYKDFKFEMDDSDRLIIKRIENSEGIQ